MEEDEESQVEAYLVSEKDINEVVEIKSIFCGGDRQEYFYFLVVEINRSSFLVFRMNKVVVIIFLKKGLNNQEVFISGGHK